METPNVGFGLCPHNGARCHQCAPASGCVHNCHICAKGGSPRRERWAYTLKGGNIGTGVGKVLAGPFTNKADALKAIKDLNSTTPYAEPIHTHRIVERGGDVFSFVTNEPAMWGGKITADRFYVWGEPVNP